MFQSPQKPQSSSLPPSAAATPGAAAASPGAEGAAATQQSRPNEQPTGIGLLNIPYRPQAPTPSTPQNPPQAAPTAEPSGANTTSTVSPKKGFNAFLGGAGYGIHPRKYEIHGRMFTNLDLTFNPENKILGKVTLSYHGLNEVTHGPAGTSHFGRHVIGVGTSKLPGVEFIVDLRNFNYSLVHSAVGARFPQPLATYGYTDVVFNGDLVGVVALFGYPLKQLKGSTLETFFSANLPYNGKPAVYTENYFFLPPIWQGGGKEVTPYVALHTNLIPFDQQAVRFGLRFKF